MRKFEYFEKKTDSDKDLIDKLNQWDDQGLDPVFIQERISIVTPGPTDMDLRIRKEPYFSVIVRKLIPIKK